MAAVAGLVALQVGCTDPFEVAQSEDTVEAYEKYLADHPNAPMALAASARLEALLLEKAKADKSLEQYDAYLKRFPEGEQHARALKEREALLFSEAKRSNTPELWKRYLEDYRKGDKNRKRLAEEMVQVHEYLEHVSLSETKSQQVNLAEDPKGPLNGWGFVVEVTNTGSETVKDMWLTIEYLDMDGNPLEDDRWPIVAAPESTVRIQEEFREPLLPGQSRTWEWTTGDLPEDWDRETRVYVSRLVRK